MLSRISIETVAKTASAAFLILSVSSLQAGAAPAAHFPVEGALAPGAATVTGGPAFSGAVMTGNTLYVSGMTDSDPQTNAIFPDPKIAARIVLAKIQHQVEKAGLTMDDLVWVQIFAADLKDYAAFNEVYRTFFKRELPARAFLGTPNLLGQAHFEVMGVAVRPQ
jgi:2-iminobutanoate/2-iminopropanoate deaminase